MTNTINKVVQNGTEYVFPTYTAGTWLSLNGTEFSNTWVTSVNSHTWAVTVNEVPTWWTNWDVLTNVNWTPTWSAPSWWDVMVSSQAGNVLTSWTKVWAGSESDYNALAWSYDSNTRYYVF